MKFQNFCYTEVRGFPVLSEPANNNMQSRKRAQMTVAELKSHMKLLLKFYSDPLAQELWDRCANGAFSRKDKIEVIRALVECCPEPHLKSLWHPHFIKSKFAILQYVESAGTA